jgi:uncharacterized DUF497 family protein
LGNNAKHGIWFEDACCIFTDPLATFEFDDRDYDEDRWIVTGRFEDTVLVVVFTERPGAERIISARKALPVEERSYFEQFLGN